MFSFAPEQYSAIVVIIINCFVNTFDDSASGNRSSHHLLPDTYGKDNIVTCASNYLLSNQNQECANFIHLIEIYPLDKVIRSLYNWAANDLIGCRTTL